jgi:hypothetical protein
MRMPFKRRAKSAATAPSRLLSIEDILWLAAVRAAQKKAHRKVSVPDAVLDLFVARGLISKEGQSFKLTPDGAEALDRLL